MLFRVESALFYSYKVPRFDDDEIQVGVEYRSGYVCVAGECIPFEK